MLLNRHERQCEVEFVQCVFHRISLDRLKTDSLKQKTDLNGRQLFTYQQLLTFLQKIKEHFSVIVMSLILQTQMHHNEQDFGL